MRQEMVEAPAPGQVINTSVARGQVRLGSGRRLTCGYAGAGHGRRRESSELPGGRRSVVKKEKNEAGISVMFNVTDVNPQEKKIKRDKARVHIRRTLKERLEEHDEMEHYHKTCAGGTLQFCQEKGGGVKIFMK